jgi:hypothetical protein
MQSSAGLCPLPHGERSLFSKAGKLSLVGRRRFVQGFHDLYILPLTMLAPDQVLPRLKVPVFHHLVTVRAAGWKRIDSYLHFFGTMIFLKSPF